MEIFADLVAEQDRIDAILCTLDDPSVELALGGRGLEHRRRRVASRGDQRSDRASRRGDDIGTAFVGDAAIGADAAPLTLDDVMDLRVKAERAPGAAVLARWQASCRDSIAALRAADPQQALPWLRRR